MTTYMIHCPFHTERTGSCNIRIDDERYICFGCGKEGPLSDLPLMALHEVSQQVDAQGDRAKAKADALKITADECAAELELAAHVLDVLTCYIKQLPAEQGR